MRSHEMGGWDAMGSVVVGRDGIRMGDGMGWDGMGWDGMGWEEMGWELIELAGMGLGEG